MHFVLVPSSNTTSLSPRLHAILSPVIWPRSTRTTIRPSACKQTSPGCILGRVQVDRWTNRCSRSCRTCPSRTTPAPLLKQRQNRNSASSHGGISWIDGLLWRWLCSVRQRPDPEGEVCSWPVKTCPPQAHPPEITRGLLWASQQALSWGEVDWWASTVFTSG